jgi:hypothetical protein
MMRAFPSAAGIGLFMLLAAPASPASGQLFPAISTRYFAAGSAMVIVTGSHSIREEVPINAQASFGDGEMTWLQFGVSGSDKLDVLITYAADREIGITIGRGKVIATGGIMRGEESECSGKVEVTGTLISGEYRCKGVTSHDPATGKLGEVDMTVSFTARS